VSSEGQEEREILEKGKGRGEPYSKEPLFFLKTTLKGINLTIRM
jgi:hypothetical protein